MTSLRTAFVSLICFATALHRGAETTAQEPIPAKEVTRTDAFGDPLPPSALVRLGTARFRHGTALGGVRFLPDGKTLLTVGVDESIRVWNIPSGMQRHELTEHIDEGMEVARDSRRWILSLRGQSLASLQRDRTVNVWDVSSGKRLGTLPAIRHLRGDLAFTPDGRHLAAPLHDMDKGKGMVRLWDVADLKAPPREFVSTKEGEEDFQPYRVLFSDNGKVIGVKVAGRGGPRLWDVTSGEELSRPDVDISRWGDCLAPDGKTLAGTTADEKGVSLWNITDSKRGPTAEVLGSALCYSPDGKTLAGLGREGLQLWDLSRNEPRKEPDLGGDTEVIALAFAPNSQTIALGTKEGRLHFCELATGKCLHRFDGFQANTGSFTLADFLTSSGGYNEPTVAFSHDGKLVAAAGLNGRVRLWNAVSGAELSPLQAGHEGEVLAAAYSPDGKWLATGAADHTVRLWDVSTGKERQRIVGSPPRETRRHYKPLGAFAVAFAPDSKRLAIGWSNGNVQLCDLTSGKEVRLLEGHESIVGSLAFATDNKHLASAGWDGRVLWWDTSTGKQIRQLVGPGEGEWEETWRPQQLVVSPDSRMLVAMRRDGPEKQFQVWELATGEMRRRFQVREAGSGLRVADLALAQGVYAAHRLSAWRVRGVYYSDYDPFGCLAVAPDGKVLAWSSEGTVVLWDLDQGKELRRFGGAEGAVHGLTFGPRGRWLASTNSDGTLRLWDVGKGTTITTVLAHRGSALGLALSPDGRTLASGGGDCSVLLWDVSRLLEAARRDRPILPRRELEDLWERLAEKNAERAGAALARLSTVPQSAVPFLRERLRPVSPAETERIAKLLADLEDNRFEVRKRATEALQQLDELAEQPLRKRLSENPPLEVRQRIEPILDRLVGFSTDPEQIRALRAVELLERIGTPEAQTLIKELSKGAPAARLTVEAERALKRLAATDAP